VNSWQLLSEKLNDNIFNTLNITVGHELGEDLKPQPCVLGGQRFTF
jgi:hypothetical protein